LFYTIENRPTGKTGDGSKITVFGKNGQPKVMLFSDFM